ncbi:MAG: leucine-rich repeat protein [Eubacterium sp.]|nr:leucine-rich repeat protein [Eubacterium sp.]
MKIRKHAPRILLLLLIFLLFNTNSADAAKNVYRVDRYGELYDYSGSSVVPIRSNVSAIGPYTFYGVKTTKFTTAGNPYFKTINGALYSKDGTLLIKCPSEKEGSFTVPSSVKKIAHSAFKDCTKLTKVTIPDSVTVMDERTFKNCSMLKQIRLSRYLTSIPSEAFSGCSSLTNITIPSSVSSIRSKAFYNCQSLRSIAIPDSVSKVGSSCFANCINLKKALLSSKMESLEYSLFNNCTELKTVENTGHIEEIEANAFRNCIHLKTFSYSNKLDTIGSAAFLNCLELGTVTIMKGTRYISYNAFNGAANKFVVDSSNPNYSSLNGMLLDEKGESLIQAPIHMDGDLDIPKGVVRIASNALTGGCFSSITIPEGVTSMRMTQFEDCENLKSIHFPASLKTFIYYTGDALNLKYLDRIVVSRSNPNFYSKDGVMYSSDGAYVIFFPSGKKGAFRLPETCKTIGDRMRYNRLSSISVSPKSKYFSSTGGVLYDSKGKQIVCFPMSKRSYRIPAGVKNITYLKKIKEDLKCKAIQVSSKNKWFSAKAGVVFDSDEETLLFYPTKKRGSYKIPSSTVFIAGDAFDDAHELTSLTITKNVRRSRYSTFYFRDCKKLKSISVNQGELNYISMNFSGCDKLARLTFPSTIMTTNLKNLPTGVTIHGWKNTYAKEAAEEAKGKFVSRGTIPNVVTGARIKKIIDKYQLSWNASSEASGYQVYTSYSTNKDLKGSGSTSCFIPEKYSESTIYIRAYKIENKKKVYGKARALDIS